MLCRTRLNIYPLQMYTYYHEYLKNTGNADAQDRWARQMIWEVARHAVGEELVVYPLMEKHLGDEGKRLADEDRREHQVRVALYLYLLIYIHIRHLQQVKDLLYKIESVPIGTQEHASIMKAVIDHLKPHNDSEEQKDLPLLQKAIGEDAASEAATSFKRTKKFVPTR